MTNFRFSLSVLFEAGTYSLIHLVITILILLSSTSLQALDLLSPFKGFFNEDETVIWHDQGQFVKLVEQDWDWDRAGRKHAESNSHPVNLTPEQVAMVLASIKTPGSTGTKNRLTVFTPSEVTLLSSPVSEALEKARKKEDIVFAIVDQGTNRSTAGRLFFLEGRLNIIFGDLLVLAKGSKSSNINHYDKPHRAGKRKESIDRDNQLMSGPGIAHQVHMGRTRPDWILIDIKKVIANYKGPEIPVIKKKVVTTENSDTTTTTSGTSRKDTDDDQAEKRRLRAEVARLRKELNEARTAPETKQPDQIILDEIQGIEEITQPVAELTIEQRMQTLKSLYEKDLISDEEYQAKRRKILDDL